MKELKIGETIKELRGDKGVSQETLAAVCDVSMQAVSKWENGQSCPDIAFLPLIAEYFQVSIDYLLTGEDADKKYAAQRSADEVISEYDSGNADAASLAEQIKQMTKEDGDTLYIIQYRNGKILDKRAWEQEKEDPENENVFIPIAFEEEFLDLKNGLHVEVWGDAGIEAGGAGMDLSAGGNISCAAVEGDVSAGGNVECGPVEGNVSADGNVECGAVEGNVTADGNIECGDIEGNVTADGNVECGEVTGNVTTGGSVSCGEIEGDVSAGGSVACGDVEGDASAGANMACGNIEGNAKAGNMISCKKIGGDAKAISIEYKK